MKETFAGRLREAARRLGQRGESSTVKDLGHEMGVKAHVDHAAIRSTLRDFMRRGEVERTAPGLYRYKGRPTASPQVRERMWRILRARRKVTVEDLQELAGASAGYAREWLRMLARRSVVRNCGKGIYRMTEDPVAMPSNEEKAEQLRNLRERKKAALKALERARGAVVVVERTISKMDDV